MSQLHKFLFDGLPVRGMLVQLTDVRQEVLKRRAANAETGAYPEAVRHLLGEMTAASVLMQSNIKFNGALVMQIFGDGPLKLAVVEVQPDLSLRSTAKVVGELGDASTLPEMVNVNNEGKCAITLDPLNKMPGQQPYQGVVPLFDDQRNKLDKFSDVLQHYMLQSEQLDTTLVLAANDTTAAGLLGASGLLAWNSIKAAKSAKPTSYAPEATRLTAPPEPLPASTVTSSLASLK